MYKLWSIIFIIITMLFSCATVYVVKPGVAPTEQTGYIAVGFVNKVGLVQFNQKNVYLVLRQIDAGRSLYIPFGSNGEVRLIALPAGSYRIDSFVYETGLESAKGDNIQKTGVYTSTPVRAGVYLEKVTFDSALLKNFVVNSGEVVNLGDYAWETKFALVGSAVHVNKSIRTDDAVLAALRETHPNLPDSLKLVSLPE